MYYTIVLVIAVVLLIIALTIVGMTITANKKQAFPDFKNTCPDYWTLSDGNICTPPEDNINLPLPAKFSGGEKSAVKHAGVHLDSHNTYIQYMDVGTTNWSGLCDKSHWSKMTGILWDGVSNTNSC
jgi:hypothetical protein